MNCVPQSDKSKVINSLAKFYAVVDMAGLILAQDLHIQRLQERIKFLEPKNNFIITKAREG